VTKLLTKYSAAFFWLSVLGLLLVAFDLLSFGPRGVAFLTAVGLMGILGLVLRVMVDIASKLPREVRDYMLKQLQAD
jgi:hypothetical protein